MATSAARRSAAAAWPTTDTSRVERGITFRRGAAGDAEPSPFRGAPAYSALSRRTA